MENTTQEEILEQTEQEELVEAPEQIEETEETQEVVAEAPKAKVKEDDDEEGSPLEAWCAGFMAGVLQNEEAWYAKNEDQMAEWIFPIMYASGLFAEEAEMAEIDEDGDLSDQMCNNIPPAIIEMFLYFHAAKG